MCACTATAVALQRRQCGPVGHLPRDELSALRWGAYAAAVAEGWVQALVRRERRSAG